MMRDYSFAFKQSLPVILAYFPLGVVFGILFVKQGFPVLWAPVMSAVVYSGATQMMVLTMMENHTPLTSILVASFFVAFRNIFYGISFFERFKPAGVLFKSWLIFGLVDGSYAIFLKNPNESLSFCNRVTWLLYLSWVVGTFIGASFAKTLPEIHGLNFILPCFFMVLVIDFYLKNRDIYMLAVPIISSMVSYTLMPENYLLIAIFLCFLTILWLPEQGVSDE